METLESIFSTDNDNVEILKGYAYKPDYKKLFFEHLGPELRKLYMNKKDKLFINKFLEASQYEYGFFDKKIDLQKAFNLYKKYADLNDYFCMYKMHVIYLCEYEKFKVTFSRVLEKIYLLKCFAYLPNYIDDWNMKLFETIDVILEIAQQLDLEDGNLDKHLKFFDLLYNKRKEYNLSENDINLMKGSLICYFHEDSNLQMLTFCTMNSLIPHNKLDYAYYNAKNKCIYFRTKLKLENYISVSEIEKFYKEVENKKLFEFYGDYGNYLIDKKNRANSEIIKLFTEAADKGYLFCSFRIYQCLIDFYSFEEIMGDYNKASMILDYLLDEIVFEKLSFSYFILLLGFLIKYSKFPDKIISNYLKYVKEINEFISSTLIRIENNNENLKDKEYYFAIKAYIYFFGFQDIEKRDLNKSIELLDKGSNLTQKIFVKKNNEFFKYNIKELMYNNKLISIDELNKSKKDLIEFYKNNSNLKYQIIDCYVIGYDYFTGLTRKKDDFVGILIYKSTDNIFCATVMDCFVKNKIKKILKNNNTNKLEKKLKDEICCICYTNKVDKIFIPCKHSFCKFCSEKIEKDSTKCPYCRTEFICII